MMSELAELQERGPEFIERPELSVSPEILWKLDLLYVAGWNIYTRNSVLGSYYFLRAARSALETGEPRRAARSLASAATILAWGGDKQARELAWAWFEKAQAVTSRLKEPYWSAYVAMKKGFMYWGEGKWPEAVTEFREAEQITFEGQVSLAMFLGDMQKISLHAQMMMGSWKEYLTQAEQFLKSSQRQENLYFTCSMLISTSLRGLVADQPESAEERNREGWEMWSQVRSITAGHQRLSALIDIYIYQGKGREAVDLLERELEAIRNETLYEFIEVWHLTMSHAQGRVMLAAVSEMYSGSQGPDEQARLLQKAENCAKTIDERQMAWADPLAQLLRAGEANLRHDRTTAIQFLADAEAGLDAAGMLMYSAAARRQRGRLIGGEEGQGLVAVADAFMGGEGVVAPGRIAAMLVPGFPE